MKYVFNFLLCILALLVTSSLTYAAASSDLGKLLDAIHSMKADFKQTLYDQRGRTMQKSYGQMALQRPGKFRWDVRKPMPQLLIANDTKLWIYDPDLEQLTIRTIQKSAGETPALLLSHDQASLEEHFMVQSLPKKSSDENWFSLTPKHPDNMFASVQMGFVHQQIREMRLQDHLGQTTSIQFQNIKMNATLPSSLFVMKPSRTVDIIDETRKK